MSAANSLANPVARARPPGLAWLLVPAVVMSLGWGLRGYIGGGPFGAMIPGALVTLVLCRYLGYNAAAAAVVVAFGTFGIGFGGNMTYGQTLGLIRESDTFAWGVTGTTLKGAIWGLLGGAVLGLGFVARHIAWRHLVLAFACMLIGVIAGIHFVNEPKLIYFSDPVNRPRGESWAGFLFGGLALLAYMRAAQPALAGIPARFALYGAIGGGIGFGGGSVFLALGALIDETWRWMPYWKYMEFTFGWIFGAALGLCAMHLRERLSLLGAAATSPEEDPRSGSWWMMVLVVAAGVVLALFPMLLGVRLPRLLRTALGVLLGFTGSGTALMLLGRRWQTAAWQAAITIAIVMAAMDWQGDLRRRGPIDLPVAYRTLYVLCAAAFSIAFVQFWQQLERPKLMLLFLFATCVFMFMGYLMGVSRVQILWPDPEVVAAAGGLAAYYWRDFGSEIIVHAIFTTLFLLSVWAGLSERRRQPAAD